MAGKSTGFLLTKSQSRHAGDPIRCTCTRQSQSAFLNRQFAPHSTILDQCLIHHQYERTTLFVKRWTFCNRFLSYTIRISLEITQGAGGLAISPHLQFRATVPRHSPIFRLLSSTQDSLRSKSVGITLENTQKKLFELLRDGKGSWSDTLPDGNTILHVRKPRVED
jgi:hypothetical protein